MTLLLGFGAKVGLDQAKRRGFMPQKTYLKKALDALNRDDLGNAVALYRLAIERHKPSELSGAVAELITAKIRSHLAKLERRLEEINELMRPKPFSKEFWLRALSTNRSQSSELKREAETLRKGISILLDLQQRMSE